MLILYSLLGYICLTIPHILGKLFNNAILYYLEDRTQDNSIRNFCLFVWFCFNVSLCFQFWGELQLQLFNFISLLILITQIFPVQGARTSYNLILKSHPLHGQVFSKQLQINSYVITGTRDLFEIKSNNGQGVSQKMDYKFLLFLHNLPYIVTMSISIITLCSKSKLHLMLLHECSYYDSSACSFYNRAENGR